MQELMGIEKDQDVINRYYATTAEVDKFIHEGEGDPGLDPMRPYFEEGGYSSWNDRLCEKFADYYEEKLDATFFRGRSERGGGALHESPLSYWSEVEES